MHSRSTHCGQRFPGVNWAVPCLMISNAVVRCSTQAPSFPALPLSFPSNSSSSLFTRRRGGIVASTSSPPSFTASNVVREFYTAINCGDLEYVKELIAEDCVYEDLVYPQPYLGRKAILEFFGKFKNITSTDLQIVIDDISKDDPSCVGVIWHLEWRGKPFPFSKGCSFYRLRSSNGKQQIIYGRDSVESAVKPGDATLVAINTVVSLLKRFPKLADWF